MIEIKNLTKSYLTNTGREYVFKNISMTLPSHKNIALMGRNGAGKSTLLRLIGGIDVPDSGSIQTEKSLSWPVGLTGGFQGSLSARDNVKFIARVYGAEGDEMARVVKYVEDFAEIGRYFDRPIKTFSSGMRSRVAFGLSLAFDFDYYLIDEAMSVGDLHFRKKATKIFKDRISRSNIILVSHGMGAIKALCDVAVIVENGQLLYYDNIAEGIEAYNKFAG